MRSLLPVCALLAVLGCDKKETGQAPTLGSASTPAATGSTAAVAVASAAATAAEKPAGGSYTGQYKSAAGALYVPDTKEFQGFKFRGDKTEDGLGEGTLSLQTAANGVVDGQGDGALGKFSLSGIFKDGVLTANIRRTKIDEDGYTGVLHAEEKDGSLVGTMKLSLARTGNALREASFSLKKK